MKTLEMERQKTEAGSGKSASPKLEMTRVIRASRARVYEAWTRPEILQQWFAPGNMIVPGATLDVRADGEYAIQMRGSIAACEGKSEDLDMSHTASIRGVYRQVVPNELLQFTWFGDWDPSEVSLVTVSLKDVEDGTEVTVNHEQFATELSRDKHQHGWGGSLAKLAKATEG
jgi:uncharacterized protein YndB with AHSA1/START domain